MTQGPRLNLDVLSILLSFIEAHELLRISPVCKFFRAEALRRVLSSVHLTRPAQLSGFCACLLSEPAVRAPWIKRLRIDNEVFPLEQSNSEDEQDGELVYITNFAASTDLAPILKHCRSLESLAVSCLDELLIEDPRIGDSIASLTTITKLDLFDLDGSKLIVGLLRRMQSRLRELSIAFSRQSSNPVIPVDMQCAASANVEILTLTCVTGIIPTSHPKEEVVPWLAVRQLILRDCMIHPSLLLCSFPHLQSVAIRQLRSAPSDQRGPSQALWPSLDRLRVQLRPCFAWHAARPIRRLEIESESYGSFTANDSAMMIRLIHQAQPVILSMHPFTCRAHVDAFWRQLGMTASRTRYLEFIITSFSAFEVIGFLTSIAPLLKNIPLICLRICTLRQGASSLARTEVERPGDRFSGALRTLLATSIPTLHYLALRTETEPVAANMPLTDPSALDLEHMWWRIARSDAGPDVRLVAIPSCDGELVRTRLLDMDRDALENFDVDGFVASG